jgi:lysozyme family protein
VKGNFSACLASLLVHEGGFTADQRDKGNLLPDGRPGSTNLGVTQATWEAFVGQKVTHDAMRALTPATVGYLYRARYWDAVAGDQLPSGIDYSVFDAAVNSGPKQASKWLQRAANVSDDGSIGPKTLAAVAAMPAHLLIRKFNEQRLAFMQGLSSFDAFGKGWTRRVREIEIASSSMVNTTARA